MKRWLAGALGLAAAALPGRAGAFDLALYDALLVRHTRATGALAGTVVDYAALAGSADWRRLVASLANVDPARLPGDAARMAFWINAYNVLAIDVVARHWPIASIRDVGSLLFPVWKREAGRVGSPSGPRAVTLDEIEHEILRPMGDPRIHGAIVCASKSCPSLRREAFRAERLDAQLEEQMRSFLADPRKGARFEPGAGGDDAQLRLSPIFDWFAGDFGAAGGVRAFVAPRLPEPTRSAVDGAGPALRLRYFDYDWSVNAAP